MFYMFVDDLFMLGFCDEKIFDFFDFMKIGLKFNILLTKVSYFVKQYFLEVKQGIQSG